MNINFILLFLIVSEYRRSFRNWFIEFEIIIFDDIYILLHIPYFIIFYYIFQKRIYINISWLSSSLFSILFERNIEYRVHAILIHCLLPLDEYQFCIISFNRIENEIYENLIHRIWKCNFDDIYQYYITLSMKEFHGLSSSLFSIPRVTTDGDTSWDYSSSRTDKQIEEATGGKESARSWKGLTQKLIRFRPSDLKRFERVEVSRFPYASWI